MCTVTYIPLQDRQFMLSTNRDEQPGRSPRQISSEIIGRQQVIFPRDAEAGGAWVAISEGTRSVCILNGAFERHHRQPPYRRSRGLMALDYFAFANAEKFIRNYRFGGMEPFTMIIREADQLIELRWDEKRLHIRRLDTQNYYIWSSATLYEPQIRKKREHWFKQWLEHRRDFSLDAILDFHRGAGDGDPHNDVVMNRGDWVKTVSITNVIAGATNICMRYQDLIQGAVEWEKIGLGSEVFGSR